MGYSNTVAHKQTNETGNTFSGANAQRKMAAVPVLQKASSLKKLIQKNAQNLKSSIIQKVKVGELTKPVGKRLASKHIYNTNFISKPKALNPNLDIQSPENMSINKFNAKQVGKIGGKRKSEESEKSTNTVFNVTVSELNNHIKTDHNQDELSTSYELNTRSYKFASAVAGDKILAFGGIQQGTGKIMTNNKSDNIKNQYDHLEKTNPPTPLNANNLYKQEGGWGVVIDSFDPEKWKLLLDARDEGFIEGESEAKTASKATEE